MVIVVIAVETIFKFFDIKSKVVSNLAIQLLHARSRGVMARALYRAYAALKLPRSIPLSKPF